MKEFWVKADPWSRDLVLAAIECGAGAVMVGPQDVPRVRELGVIKTVSEQGDIRWGKDIVAAHISSGAEEEAVAELSREKRVLVTTADWKVIPLENLVARGKNIFVEVTDMDEARLASGILERGVEGVVIANSDAGIVRQILLELGSSRESIPMELFEVRRVTPVGMGHRVCIDTCTLMGPGEGCLVGNSSSCLFLVHSESIEGPYAAPRPFRINAGGVHAYVMTPSDSTRYLCELAAGDEILGVNHRGETSVLVVGRVKIEKRPMLLIEADSDRGQATLICQNAETIRLVGSEGEALSVASLKAGSVVKGCRQEPGRHFGRRIHESIIER